MKRILFLMLAVVAVQIKSEAAIAIAHRYNVTSFPVTITSTTANNGFVVITDNSVTPASVQFASGTAFTLYGCQPYTVISHLCVWYQSSIASGKTSITCTTCGTTNAVHAWEISGQDATNFIDHGVTCYNTNAVCNTPANTLVYTPGYSAEAVLYGGNCTSSATTVTGTGVTWTSAVPNGEPGADGILSSAGAINGAPNSGCGGNSGIIIGLKQAGASQGCVWDIGLFEVGLQSGSSGNPTSAAELWHTGDLVVATPWCLSGCTVTSVTIGTDSTTLALGGSSDPNAGQPFIYYDLSSGVSGAQTITANITGTRTNSQVAYYEFVPSGGCTASLDLNSSVGTGTGTAVNTPSITPSAAGELLFNFTAVHGHTAAVNSPWQCNYYNTGVSGDTLDCFFQVTVNSSPYILSSSSGSTANNITQTTPDAWQGIISAFKLTGSAAPCVNRITLLGLGC